MAEPELVTIFDKTGRMDVRELRAKVVRMKRKVGVASFSFWLSLVFVCGVDCAETVLNLASFFR